MLLKREYLPLKARGIVRVGPPRCFRDNHVGLAHAIAIGVIHIFAVQQNHHIRILLNRTRLTQIRNHRTLIGALLRTTVQLRQRNHRNIQLLSQSFRLRENSETSC